MKYHEIEMAGKFLIQKVSSNPAWTAADTGRLIYNTTVNKAYLGTNVAWVEYAIGNLANYALIASDNAWAADQTPTIDNTYSLGSTEKRWQTCFAEIFEGTVTTATYADVAEIYKTSEQLPIGTVVTVCEDDGDAEVSPTMGMTDDVIGVVSEFPAFLMNREGEGQPIGLIGKLPIRVVGKVKKGEALCSAENGTARKYLGLENGYGYKFAYALETKTDEDERLIMCLLRK